MSTQPHSRNVTVSLPEDLAEKVDLMAKRESRTTSELFCEAFRTYFARQVQAQMRDARERGDFNPAGYTREDTERLIDESRRDMKALAE